MQLTREQVQNDLNALPVHYKTADVDRLIRQYVKQKADVSPLRPYILAQQQFHRIYYYVSLNQIRNVNQRMNFIHENLLFSDWWHTDQIISFVADLELIRRFATQRATSIQRIPLSAVGVMCCLFPDCVKVMQLGSCH